VTIIHRRDKFRASKIVQERAFANPRIKIVWDSVVQEVSGNPSVHEVAIKNLKTDTVSSLPVSGLFVLIGQEPDTAFISGQVELDDAGNIPTDADMNTNLPGVFAAGDVRQKSFRQIVTACSDGAIAANSAEKYIESLT
jgi:thioredoxin reductase (NADPH)